MLAFYSDANLLSDRVISLLLRRGVLTEISLTQTVAFSSTRINILYFLVETFHLEGFQSEVAAYFCEIDTHCSCHGDGH